MRFSKLAGLMLLCAGCSPVHDQAVPAAHTGARYFGDTRPPAGNVLTFTNGAEPERIDPGVISGQPDGRVARVMFEGLTTPDPRTLEPTPGQAYRWEISAD